LGAGAGAGLKQHIFLLHGFLGSLGLQYLKYVASQSLSDAQSSTFLFQRHLHACSVVDGCFLVDGSFIAREATEGVEEGE